MFWTKIVVGLQFLLDESFVYQHVFDFLLFDHNIFGATFFDKIFPGPIFSTLFRSNLNFLPCLHRNVSPCFCPSSIHLYLYSVPALSRMPIFMICRYICTGWVGIFSFFFFSTSSPSDSLILTFSSTF